MRPRPFWPAAVGLALLAACSGAGSGVTVAPAPTAPSPPDTSRPPAPPSTPASPPSSPATTSAPPGPAVTPLDWEACDDVDGWDCARLDVPLDHADPSSGTLTLAVTRRAATDPASRIGSLVVNPGGPGASGLEAVRFLDVDLDEELRRRFDLVGVDPRGVGESDGVGCIADDDKDAYLALDPTPDDEAEIDAAIDLQVAVAERCAEALADVLPHLGTQSAARDLDWLRAALGDEGLTYLGFSYGTALGAAYAQLHPDRVRALVLDGPVSPAGGTGDDGDDDDLPGPGGGAYGGQDFEGAFDRFAEACAASDACPLQEDAVALLERLLDEADGDPLPAPAADPDRPLGPGLLDVGVAAALYDTATWPMLAVGLRDAAGGDGSLLQRLADLFVGRDLDGSWSDEIDARIAVACADTAERPSVAEVREAYVRWFLDDEDVADWPLEDCLGWRETAEALPPVGAAGTPPLLVVGTVGDPATPYENAAAMAEALGTGVVLTYEGDGHTAFGRSDCIDAAVTAYLVDLVVPEQRTCAPDGGAATGGEGAGGGSAYTPLDREELREQLEAQLVQEGTPAPFAACFAKDVTAELTEEQLVYAWLGLDRAGADDRIVEIARSC